jgi:putative ABC transport system permease protein
VIPISYNLRNLRVRKATTAAAAGGLALVVFIFATAQMLSNGVKKAVHQAADPSVAIVLRKGSGAEMESGIEQPKVPLIAATPGVVNFANGRPEAIGELVAVVLLDKIGTNGGVANVTIRGVADDTLAFRPTVKIAEGRAATPGTDEVIVGKSLTGGRYKGIDLGQTFEMRKNRPMKIVGVFTDNGSAFESEIWADADRVRVNFGRGSVVSSVRVRLDSPSKFDGFKAALESNRQLDVGAMREEEYYDKQSQGTALFLGAMGFIIALFASLGAMIGAMITMHGTVAQRQREIGTLRALGFTRTQILVSFLIEAIVLALLGGVVGALASLAMSTQSFSMLNFATFSEIVFRFEPSVQIIVSAMIVAGVMGLVGGFWPAVRAARVNPVQAMRGA